MPNRSTFRLCSALAFACVFAALSLSIWAQPLALAKPAQGPNLSVEYFGQERGFTVGANRVNLLCVVRNVGNAVLPANSLRLRCYAMMNLGYTSGDVRPALPELRPGQATAFRWTLEPKDAVNPLLAAVLFEPVTILNPEPEPSPGGGMPLRTGSPARQAQPADTARFLPQTRAVLAPLLRLPAVPRPIYPNVKTSFPPQTDAKGDVTWVGNDRVALQILRGERDVPFLMLHAREGGPDGAQWRTVAVSQSAAEVISGEEGQVPWGETFRWIRARGYTDRDTGILVLTGEFGRRWGAELRFEIKRDTAAINGTLKLVPRRTLRLNRVVLPRLLAQDARPAADRRADGSPLSVFAPEPVLPEDTQRLQAERVNGVTFGMTWPEAVPLPNWQWNSLAPSPNNLIAQMGAACEATGEAPLLLPGGTVEFSFRLFAFSPSESVRDALQFQMK